MSIRKLDGGVAQVIGALIAAAATVLVAVGAATKWFGLASDGGAGATPPGATPPAAASPTAAATRPSAPESVAASAAPSPEAGTGAGVVAQQAGNRRGSPVFADPQGSPVDGVPPTIPYGTAVDVKCKADNLTGMDSVSSLYLIEGGQWAGMFVVADTMTNGGVLGDAGSPNVDARVPDCPPP